MTDSPKMLAMTCANMHNYPRRKFLRKLDPEIRQEVAAILRDQYNIDVNPQ